MASNTVKRQRKRRRIDQDGDPEFQVAPMVDVLLVLMLFFMAITSTEVLKKDKNLQLADAKHAKPHTGHPANEIVVNVDRARLDGGPQFSMNGQNYAFAEDMQGILQAAHDKNPDAYVVIRADRNTEYSNVSDLMTTCAKAGITTVTFAVLIGGHHNDAPPATN